MKEYLILKDFKGSQDGLSDGRCFTAGSTAELSDSLVKALGPGYVRAATVAAQEIAAAPPALADAVREAIAPREHADGETLEEGEHPPSNPADLRDTKVTGPEETKPGKPFTKKGKR